MGCHFLLQCMKVKSESEVAQSCPTLAIPWTAAHQAPLSMGFSRQKYWSGVPLPSPTKQHACSVTQSCQTFCDPMDCSPPGFSLHGILQARILEWVAMPSSRYQATAAAAAKLLQSCPTLCDPIDGSPSGSPVSGILQARTLEWVAISVSNA